jgi:cyclic pyranopterin phosphate synthase
MFSHLDTDNQPIMVDVGGKSPSRRSATARALVRLPEEVLAHFRDGEINGKKGPVFQTAILAGIMACKKTSDLIPLCHPLALDDCKIRIRLNEAREAEIECSVSCHQKTGVEMEALTGASVAALTLYDMCKAFSHHIVIREIRLMEKTGGKSDFISDRASSAPSPAVPPSPTIPDIASATAAAPAANRNPAD